MAERVLALNPNPSHWQCSHTHTHTHWPLSPASCVRALCFLPRCFTHTHTHTGTGRIRTHTMHILAPSHKQHHYSADLISPPWIQSHSFMCSHKPRRHTVTRSAMVAVCVCVCVYLWVPSHIWWRCLSRPYKMNQTPDEETEEEHETETPMGWHVLSSASDFSMLGC